MNNTPIFFAPNVHTGGGLVLLKSLLGSWDANEPLRAFLDERARPVLSVPPVVQVHWVAPRIVERMAAQRRLRTESNEGTTIICFNGLPPLLSTRGSVVVFLQNRLHLTTPDYRQYGPKVALRLAFERLVSHALRHRVNRYLVQTPSMAQALVRWYGQGKGGPPKVSVLPFTHAPQPGTSLERPERQHKWDFLYVADGLPHKNHRKLLDAWCHLAKEGLKPSLALTLSPAEQDLLGLVAELRSSLGLKVENLGHLSHENMLAAYGKARALIYPSLVESFGLPLIEARQLNLPIIAAELDYVRDVCEPEHTFDPNSEVSIARAVRRFLDVAHQIQDPPGPDAFWHAVLLTHRGDGTAPNAGRCRDQSNNESEVV